MIIKSAVAWPVVADGRNDDDAARAQVPHLLDKRSIEKVGTANAQIENVDVALKNSKKFFIVFNNNNK